MYGQSNDKKRNTMGCSTCNNYMVQTIVNIPMEIAANLILESTTGQVHDFKACFKPSLRPQVSRCLQ